MTGTTTKRVKGSKFNHRIAVLIALFGVLFAVGKLVAQSFDGFGGIHPVVVAPEPDPDFVDPDRIMAWDPGVRGGIPERTNIFANIKDAPYNAVGDGVADDTLALSNAIVDVTVDGVIYLPAGDYRLTSDLYFPTKTNFVIRGDGPDLTAIHFDMAASEGFGMQFGAGTYTLSAIYTASIDSGAETGSTNIMLATTPTGIAPGVLMLIDELNDGTNVTANGSGAFNNFSDRPRTGTRNHQQFVQIQTVTDGTNVTFLPPLTSYFDNSPEASMYTANISRWVGFEDLRFTSDSALVNDYLRMYFSINSWVKNCEFDNMVGTAMQGYGMLWCTIRDSLFHDPQLFSVGAGYGVELKLATATLVENNTFWTMYSNIILGGGSTASVVGYNFTTNVYNGAGTNYLLVTISGNHSSHPMRNLFEGNITPEIQFDAHWGSSSESTVFRNALIGTDLLVTNNQKALSMDLYSQSNNVMANILGTPEVAWDDLVMRGPGASTTSNFIYRIGYPKIGNNSYTNATSTPTTNDLDLRVEATAYFHGNYDYFTGAVSWTNSNQNPPNSYYLDAKPSWFGTNTWPAIGPDVSGLVTEIPAQTRYLALP